MKKSVRLLSLVLAAVMILPVLTSCSGDKKTDDANETQADTQQRFVEESGYELPMYDYKGNTCSFCIPGDSLNIEEETGESLNDAIYRRNSLVESLYNVDLAFIEPPTEGYNEWVAFVQRTILSGDDSYQIIANGTHVMAAESLTKNQYNNLLSYDELDFSQPWWTSEFQKSANLGGALYVTIGNIDTSFYSNTSAIFFNKQLAQDLRIDNLYDLVREKKWTLDMLKKYTAVGMLDINGDGEMRQEDDQFGLVCYRCFPVDAFVTAFHEEFIDFDNEGLPHLRELSDHYVDIQETLNAFIVNNKEVLYAHDDGTTEFLEGRALFEATRLLRGVEYRAMDNDFGILPYPMWDEDQGQYYTHNEIGMGYSIPVTTDGHMAAGVLEALCYLGYKMVKPVYYDKTLKGKTVRDVESQEMLDLLFDNITYDFVEIYGHYFYMGTNVPDPSLMLRTTLFEGKSLSVEWAKKKRIFIKKIDEMIDKLS